MAYTMTIDLDMHQVYNVSFAVGAGKPNVRDDVMLVQTLMKLAKFTRNNPGMGPVEGSSSITVDGIFGPQTQRMIKAFEDEQRVSGKLLIADGFVESAPKDGFTKAGVQYKIIHLNRAAIRGSGWEHEWLPFSQGTKPLLRQSLQKGAKRPPPSPHI